ncbi:MAG TPA: pitrilysin family protein [Pyrinomonadaceae bacterium]|nr:insulinase family protein [Chloracidobacterium sp.]MBP9935834.1 insulinase family protein [Pyrinomonadaceae bacterium]MBK7803001.1 insulinase family protein [Chloracidobacterium sp.]MBK9438349.1 insulinase family protein [Chloracidobacterium sp.]MBL0240766.1 insulinase family protein [Chloracidobacterium sp.]
MKNSIFEMKKRLFRSQRLCVAAVILGLFSVAGYTQKETPPAGGQPKAFVFPKQDTYKLPNGMTVTLVQYGAVPKVAMQAVISAGSLNEKAGKRWISDIVATMLKEGTATRSAEQIARETADMGGSIFTSASTDKTTVGGEVLSEFDTRFVELMADVIRDPKFSASDLEKNRENKLRENAIGRAQPSNIAWENFRQTIFPGHPYGEIFASDDTIKGYSLDDVKEFYSSQFGAARTHLYIVGQFNPSNVKAAIQKAFGSWKKGPDAIRSIPTVAAKRSMTVIDRPGAPQSTIYLGMPAVSPSDADFIKFTVMDSLLGSSFGSRITSNIREAKGYTYSPSSMMWNRFKTGYWIETADVTTEATGASVKEILFEIERLKSEPPTAAELQGIKNYLVGIYVLQNSARTGVIGQIESGNYNELGKNYLDTYVQNIAAVTPADVSAMAKKYLSADKMTLVVVGDRSKIDEQLKPYGN